MSSSEVPARSDTVMDTLRVLRRRWLPLVACILLFGVVAAVLHERRQATYQSTASVAFGLSTLSDTALEVNTASGNPERDAGTNVLIAKSEAVAAAVKQRLKLPQSPQLLANKVDVSAAANANVLDITASWGDPVGSQRLANAFATEYINFLSRSQTEGIDETERTLRAQLAALPGTSDRATAIRSSLERLAQLRAVASGNARVIGAADPGGETGLGLPLMILIGLLIGAAAGATLAFVVEAVDRRAGGITDFEREYGLPVLSAVPRSAFRHERAADRRAHLEPYRILRSALDISTADREVFTVLVTSAAPGEGKTSVAVDLAQAVALAGRSVTLVELDLRRPTLSRHFDIDPRRGVTSVLWNRLALEQAVVQPDAELGTLSVLPSGQLPPNPSELLASHKLDDLLERVAAMGSGEQRMVIIDAPPLLAVSDAQVLLNNAAIDRVLLVARAGQTTYDDIRRARAILDRHLLQPIGVVVTGTDDLSEYGYATQEPEPLDGAAPPSGDQPSVLAAATGRTRSR